MAEKTLKKSPAGFITRSRRKLDLTGKKFLSPVGPNDLKKLAQEQKEKSFQK